MQPGYQKDNSKDQSFAGGSFAINCMICSFAILGNFAPPCDSHVNTFGAAGALIDRFQGNLFDQLFNPLSEFFELIPGRDFKKIVVIYFLPSGQGGYCLL